MDALTTVRPHDADVTRYHPGLVALHWILAALVVMELAAGLLVLAKAANSDPSKADGLRMQMTFGVIVGVLIVARLLVRVKTRKPPPAAGGWFAHVLARANHWAFYAALIGMVASGLGMAIQGGLLPLLRGEAVTLPEFETLATYPVHVLLSRAVLALLALHLAGVAYHLLWHRENLLRRVWFGPRTRSPSLWRPSPWTTATRSTAPKP